MTTRTRLPDRRPAATSDITHAGQQFTIAIGFDPATGQPMEVLGSSSKVGSQTAALVSDSCSLALQTGLDLAEIGRSLSKAPRR